ncbi:DUF4265 domain-containing protein [Pseudomonas sp. P7548]|uniref:DUF4265 domain-containing protein n=1 Tax=Pseudomonas sp. P7548 TaxID=2726981 RepID=UPI0015C0DAF3|nr:DUF4265 domain-containing protein [Pseudomonas sp. P7548]NWE20407.1 DUF4265 domain-containing protein [Pseudomonas sp. P7548]
MKYQAGEYEAVHQSPVWRDRANFIFAAHLGTKDGNNEWEQLWGQKTAAHKFIVCCIPFFARNIALGDEVETDIDFVVQRVIQRGWQTTFRVWFASHDKMLREALMIEIESMSPLMEWSSGDLLALSLSDGVEAQRMANYLHACEEKDLLKYETGRR